MIPICSRDFSRHLPAIWYNLFLAVTCIW